MSACLKATFLLLALLISPVTHSKNFVEGTHYSVVDGEPSVSTAKETVEYFSFSCPGCYAMEPYINKLKEQLPSLNLRLVHLPFGGRKAGYSQKAFVLMELLNASEHHEEVFKRIHLQKNDFGSKQELIEFFQDLGYDEAEVRYMLNSFAADSMLRKMNKQAITNKIRSVPTIIVNGKYQVNSRAIYSGTSLPDLVEYLDGLP